LAAIQGSTNTTLSFQAPQRDEKTSVITEIVSRSMQKYIKNRGFPPEHVILFRNGCSEGQFRMVIAVVAIQCNLDPFQVLKYEVPLLKFELAKVHSVKLTVIVVNKMQNIRFFKDQVCPHLCILGSSTNSLI